MRLLYKQLPHRQGFLLLWSAEHFLCIGELVAIHAFRDNGNYVNTMCFERYKISSLAHRFEESACIHSAV